MGMKNQFNSPMTLTTKKAEIAIILKFGNKGTVTIEWGDGKNDDVDIYQHSLFYSYYGIYQVNIYQKTCLFAHTYADASTHTITVTGEDIIGIACGENQLISLDVSMNTTLTKLRCYQNRLTNLDVSKNSALTELWCFDNQLTGLDVSKNTALMRLWCFNNRIANLDVSGNTALTELYDDKEPEQSVFKHYYMFC